MFNFKMNKSFLIILTSYFIVGMCEADTSENLLDAVKKALPAGAVQLAKNSLAEDDGVMGKLGQTLTSALENLPFSRNLSEVTSIDEGEDIFRKKCQKAGHNVTYDTAQVAKEDLQECLKDILNFDTIQEEIEKNKHNGSLDVVFKKYCKKMPILKGCIANFTDTIEPCLEGNEKVAKGLILNITDSLDRFVCYKEGDRIALFIAEGGPECLTDKVEAVQQCVNQTYAKHGSLDVPQDLNQLPAFKLEEEECRDVNRMQLCIVTELEKCSEPTPANIIDSLFNFIRQSTPCASFKPESQTSAGGLPLPLALLLLAALSTTY